MSKVILITGGARSGKSVIAEKQAISMGNALTYIATAQVYDDEMAERVKVHQSRRGKEWTTIAAPYDLADALIQSDKQGPCLVDCLTLWLSNIMLAEQNWQIPAKNIISILPTLKNPVIFVTNEVGAGIVPENKLARQFRDAAGTLNQWIASEASEVYMAVAGLPLKVK